MRNLNKFNALFSGTTFAVSKGSGVVNDYLVLFNGPLFYTAKASADQAISLNGRIGGK